MERLKKLEIEEEAKLYIKEELVETVLLRIQQAYKKISHL